MQYLHEAKFPYVTLIWTKDTIKVLSNQLVNNCEVIFMISGDPKILVPSRAEYPLNSKSIKVRPTKKWKHEDEVTTFGFALLNFPRLL
jgi:hypothetical protein